MHTRALLMDFYQALASTNGTDSPDYWNETSTTPALPTGMIP
jgi:hypothetical protein